MMYMFVKGIAAQKFVEVLHGLGCVFAVFRVDEDFVKLGIAGL